MAPGRREPNVEAADRGAARGNLVDADPGTAPAVLAEFDHHVLYRHGRIVADLDLDRQKHTGGRHASHHLQPLDREIAPVGRFGGAVNKPDRHAIGGEPAQRRHGFLCP